MHDDFYIVLPSNSNALDHPDNRANKFIVSWERPMEFEELNKWRVALTEMSFFVPPVSEIPRYGVQYVMQTPGAHTSLRLNFAAAKLTSIKFQGKDKVHLKHEIDSTTIRLYHTASFKLVLADPSDAKKLGFSENQETLESIFNKNNKQYEILCSNIKTNELSCEVILQSMLIFVKDQMIFHDETLFLDQHYKWRDTNEMLQTIKKNFPMIFAREPHIGVDGRVQLSYPAHIKSITFLNGFNYVLGNNI
jgi:hypothetical protein